MTSPSREFSTMASSEAVLISIHPEHAQKIFLGEKRLEFRRVWASRQVSSVVIYVTAPTRKIVGIAYVKEVHRASPTALWNLAKEVGGGLSREQLYGYFKGKKTGYAIEFEQVLRFPHPVDPHDFFQNFRAPQSFAYVASSLLASLEDELANQRALLKGQVLFVGGVHGVGKTTLCESYARIHGVLHKSAGQLIKEARGLASADPTKAVSDINENQKLLIDEVKRIRASGRILLLDGHFAVFDAFYRPTPLAIAVFSELGITGVILIVDKPEAIAARLSIRDENRTQVGKIAALQKLELLHGQHIAQSLCIPCAKLIFGDTESFNAAAQALTSQF
ncbi:MAG TPA: AAA family ATPase [Azonexus sp.]|nr:AAA family ATPase [Azonexus sp.]